MAKKRANGEGSIRKKPNGRWEGRYTQGIDPSTGRAIRQDTGRMQRETGESHPGQPWYPGEPQRGLHGGGVVPAMV